MFGWDFWLMLSRDYEDEMWSRFMIELLIRLQEVTLARWTQPSGPLCLCNVNFKVSTKYQNFDKMLTCEWTLTSFELPSSHARVTSIKFTKRHLVSQWVSQGVSDKHNQWSDSGPIKSSQCTICHLWGMKTDDFWQTNKSSRPGVFCVWIKYTNGILSKQPGWRSSNHVTWDHHHRTSSVEFGGCS